MLTAAVLCVAAVVAFHAFPKQQFLVLKNEETNETFCLCPADDGSSFSVSFIHSVNQTPVTETYVVEDGEIYVTELQYYGFGAGMPTELEEGCTL